MFGYATNETSSHLPLSIHLAHRLAEPPRRSECGPHRLEHQDQRGLRRLDEHREVVTLGETPLEGSQLVGRQGLESGDGVVGHNFRCAAPAPVVENPGDGKDMRGKGERMGENAERVINHAQTAHQCGFVATCPP